MRSQAGFSCDQGMKVGTKNQNPCAAGGENCVIVRSLVWVNNGVRQTDRQTAASVAQQRDKNIA